MSNWQLCPLKNGTFPLIQDILDEVMDVVQPAKHFHIGGDEARELGKIISLYENDNCDNFFKLPFFI
jgi:N-acetyl-beta-hexosaminidase